MLSRQQMETLMCEALAEARLGMMEGEAPIGCVIARGSGASIRVLARGHNRVNALQRKTAHAEIVAFENAASPADGAIPLPPDADDAILVTTLEPCVMCFGAAMEAGVKTVLYGLKAPADGGVGRVKPPDSPESHTPEVLGDILADESRALFVSWLAENDESSQAAFVKQLLALTAEGHLSGNPPL